MVTRTPAKNGKGLDQICTELGIPTRTLTEEQIIQYREQRKPAEVLLRAMKEIYSHTNGTVVMIGGLSVQPQLLGFRQMRKASNDLDCVTTNEGIKVVYAAYDGALFRTTNYNDVFLDVAGTPVSFAVGDTHGFHLPDDFWADTRVFPFEDGNIRTIGAEWLIMMKTRRRQHAGRAYGKDRLDVANAYLAPHFKGTAALDSQKVAELMREHVTLDKAEILTYLEDYKAGEKDLRLNERPIFAGEMAKLASAVDRAYQ